MVVAQINGLTPRQQKLLTLSARENALPEHRRSRIEAMRLADATGEKPMPRSCYAIPETRSYAIHNWEAAQVAIRDAKGTKLEGRVKLAVKRRYGRTN
jgi:hypothetical protein